MKGKAHGKLSSATPRGNEPKGGKQSAGQTKHARSGGYNMAGGKIEHLKGMPTVHTGGGKGGMAGVSTRGKSMTTGKVT